MQKVSVIRPQITDIEKEKRLKEIEKIISEILKKSVKLIDRENRNG